MTELEAPTPERYVVKDEKLVIYGKFDSYKQAQRCLFEADKRLFQQGVEATLMIHDNLFMVALPDDKYPVFSDAILEVRNAESSGRMGLSQCMHCHHLGFYYPAGKALALGHCYSEEGMREYTSISQLCEFCFDMVMDFSEEEEQEQEQEPEDA
jgi:hypothetical protein